MGAMRSSAARMGASVPSMTSDTRAAAVQQAGQRPNIAQRVIVHAPCRTAMLTAFTARVLTTEIVRSAEIQSHSFNQMARVEMTVRLLTLRMMGAACHVIRAASRVKAASQSSALPAAWLVVCPLFISAAV